MKKQFIKVLTLCAIFAVSATMLTSCDDDINNAPEPAIDPVFAPNGAYILNEGSMGKNNSTLDFVSMDNNLTGKVFASVNGEGLGDTGQDIIEYGGRIYVSVFGSSYIAKLDLNGKLIEKYAFTEEEGQPNHLAYTDGNVYVSLYSGKVAKFDTTSIAQPKGFAKTGSLPEQMSVYGDLLLVTNSSNSYAGKTNDMVSVIDLKTFAPKQEFKLVDNLQSIAVVLDSVYVTYYNADYSISMMNLDIKNTKAYAVSPATKIASHGSYLYCANSATVYDENWNATTSTTFFKRDTKTGKDSDLLDLTGCDELKSATVYLLEVNPYNGDIYVGTSNYVTNGKMYRFGEDGKLIAKFETSSVNPNNMVFLAK